MLHCHRCQEVKADVTLLEMGLEHFGTRAPELLTAMYEYGVVATEPDMVSGMLDVPPGAWSRTARAVIDGDQPLTPGRVQVVADWLGVLPQDSSATVARHRRAQGEWRADVLGWPAGPPTDARAAARYATLPNCLAVEHEGQDVYAAGVNLMSQAAVGYAQQRCPVVRSLGGLVERERLHRNTLSSQPLAFSVAGEFRAHPPGAAAVFGELLGYEVEALGSLTAPDDLVPDRHRVPQTRSGGYRPLEEYALDGVEAEWFPPRWAHSGDQSGCDLAALVLRPDGRRVLVSIEVKYVDTFSRAPVQWERYRAWLEPLGISPASLDVLVAAGASQVLRQVMITESVRRVGLVAGAPASGHVDESLSVVLARDADRQARGVVDALAAAGLPVAFWSIADLLQAAEQQPRLRQWAGRTADRYLRTP